MWKQVLVSSALLSATATEALPFGGEGHSIVAELAQHGLTPAAQDAVTTILKDVYPILFPFLSVPSGDIALASLSSWPDGWRPAHAETGPWHFFDIPYDLHNGVLIEEITFEQARNCTPDTANPGLPTCIVDALTDQLNILATANDPLIRWQALNFMVHFVGDLHQPMHCIERDGDQGGNKLAIQFMGNRPDGWSFTYPGTLHSLWDTGLVQLHVYDWGSYVTELEGTVVPMLDASAVEQGTYIDWETGCHKLGIKACKSLPPNTPTSATPDNAVKLTDNYSDQVKVDLCKQLAEAGIRLGSIPTSRFQPLPAREDRE